MPNLLIDEYPYHIEALGQRFEINPDFRNILTIFSAYEDQGLSQGDGTVLLFYRLFDMFPSELSIAIPMIHRMARTDPELFLAMGEAAVAFVNFDEKLKEGKDGPLYSFTKDDKYIKSAIEKSHRIDLSAGAIHWWKFISLFFDLDEGCFFSKLIDLRRKKKRGKTSKEENEYIAENPELFDLPGINDPEDKALNDEIEERFRVAFARRIGEVEA